MGFPVYPVDRPTLRLAILLLTDGPQAWRHWQEETAIRGDQARGDAASLARKSGTMRNATHADIPEMMRIRGAVRENRLANPDKVTASHYADFINTGEIWVCDGRRLVGFSAGDARYVSARPGSIWAVFIDSDHEGKGIAAQASSLRRSCYWRFRPYGRSRSATLGHRCLCATNG